MKSRVRTRTHGSVRGRHPSGVPPTRLSTENSKAKVISRRCAIFRPATAVFRIINLPFDLQSASIEALSNITDCLLVQS